MLVVVWQVEGNSSAERKRQIERAEEEGAEVMVIVLVQVCYGNVKGDFRWCNVNRMVVMEKILMEEGWWDIVVLAMPMVNPKTIVGVERR